MRVLVTYHVSSREPVVIALANAFHAHNETTQMQEHIQVIDAIDIARVLYGSLPSFEFDAMLTELNRLTKPPTMPPSTSTSGAPVSIAEAMVLINSLGVYLSEVQQYIADGQEGEAATEECQALRDKIKAILARPISP